MDPLASWLAWPQEDALGQGFLSDQFSLLCRSGVPQSVPKKIIKAEKEKDKDKKKDKKAAKKAEPQRKVPFDLFSYDALSDFAAYAQIRRAILDVRSTALLQLRSGVPQEEETEEDAAAVAQVPVSQCTMLGLRTSLDILGDLYRDHPQLAERMLTSLLDILQGVDPESLAKESAEFVDHLQQLLENLARQPSRLRGLVYACLMSLAIARGTPSIMARAALMLLSNRDQIVVPTPKILSRVIAQAHAIVFPAGSPSIIATDATTAASWDYVKLAAGALDDALSPKAPKTAGALACDGHHVYIHTGIVLAKVGTGYNGTTRGQVAAVQVAAPRNASVFLAWIKGRLLLRYGDDAPGTFTELDTKTLEPLGTVAQTDGEPVGTCSHTLFVGDDAIGVIEAGENGWRVRYLTLDRTQITVSQSVNVESSVSHVDAFGPAAWDDTAALHNLASSSDAPVRKIVGGASTGLMLTEEGTVKVLTAAKETLGIKTAPGRWTPLPLPAGLRVVDVYASQTENLFVFLGEDGKLYAVGDAGAKGSDSPVELLFSGETPVAAACLTADSRILVVCKDGGLLSLQKGDGKADKDKTLVSCHPHPLASNKSKKGTCGNCKKKVSAGKGKKDSDNSFRCETCDYLLCNTCRQTSRAPRSAEYSTDVIIKSLDGFAPVSIAAESDRIFLVSAQGEVRLAAPAAVLASGEPERCPDGTHVFQNERALICKFCGECTSKGKTCYRASKKDRAQRGEPCGCGQGDSGCTKCGICRSCDKQPRARQAYGLTTVPGLGDDIVTQAACGTGHALILLASGKVLATGNNDSGQLGLGDATSRPTAEVVPLPDGIRATYVAAGSNFSVVGCDDGSVFTFGANNAKELGREPTEALPANKPGLVKKFDGHVRWLSVARQRTSVSIGMSIVDESILSSSSALLLDKCVYLITGEKDKPTLAFNLVTKVCSTLAAFGGLVGVSTCTDPFSRVLWTIKTSTHTLTAYDPLLASLSSAPHDFLNPEAVLLHPSAMLPQTDSSVVSPAQLSLALLASLDGMSRGRVGPQAVAISRGPRRLEQEEYHVVKRFESSGGGWGYGGGSSDAIAFTVDSEVLLGGVGLYGAASSEFVANIELVIEGSPGSVLASASQSYVLDQPSGDASDHWFGVMFPEPFLLDPGTQYAVIAKISSPNGASSSCGSCGRAMVTEQGVSFTFTSSSSSGNGTDVSSGQIPALLFHPPVAATTEVVVKTPTLSKKFYSSANAETITRFTELIGWAWSALQAPLYELNLLGGPEAVTFAGVMALRLLKTVLSTLFSKDLNGALTGFALPDTTISDATAEAILACRDCLTNILAAIPENSASAGQAFANAVKDTLRGAFQVFYPMPAQQVALVDRLFRKVDPDANLTAIDRSMRHLGDVLLDALAAPSSRFVSLFEQQTPDSSSTEPVVLGLEEFEQEEAISNLETSTNRDQAKRLLENTERYWESNGPAGTHWIELQFNPGFVITELVMVVITQDSYRPARLTIKTGQSEDDLSTFDTINCSSARRGNKIPIMSDCTEHYPVVRICIEADGINCRINGILVTTVRQKTGSAKLPTRPNPYGDYLLMRENMTAGRSDPPSFGLIVRKLLSVLTNKNLDPELPSEAAGKLLAAVIAQLSTESGGVPDKRVIFADSILAAVHDLLATSDPASYEAAFSSPLFSSILPLVLAHSTTIARSNPNSALQLLTSVRRPLGQVTRLCSTLRLPDHAPKDPVSLVVESGHPYEVAARDRKVVSFNADVKWMVVSFDPRCVTVQREDEVNLFLGDKDPVLVHTYFAKDSWPTRPIVLPGNKLVFELSTASSYVDRDNREDLTTHFGYKATVFGYAFDNHVHPLRLLERELAFVGGQCASYLLNNPNTVPAAPKEKEKEKGEKEKEEKKRGRDKKKKDKGGKEAVVEAQQQTSEAVRAVLSSDLFSRGLSPSVLPSLDEVMQGLTLESLDFTARSGIAQSHDHVFLREFVDLVHGTAGGRLAAWMQGPHFVDPDSCVVEMSTPKTEAGVLSAEQGVPVTFTVHLRSFDGNPMVSPGLGLTVRETAAGTEQGQEGSDTVLAYSSPVVNDDGVIHCVSANPGCNLSPEELRFLYMSARQSAGGFTQDQPSVAVRWTPRNSGAVKVDLLLDGIPVKGSPFNAEVAASTVAPPVMVPTELSDAPEIVMDSTPCELIALGDCEIRAAPTIEALVIGRVPRDVHVEVSGESVVNQEGVWAKLPNPCALAEEEMRHLDCWVLQQASEAFGGSVLLLDPTNTFSASSASASTTTTTTAAPFAAAVAAAAPMFPAAAEAPVAAVAAAPAAPAPAPADSVRRTAFPLSFGELPTAQPAAAAGAGAPAAAAAAAAVPDAVTKTPPKANRRVSFATGVEEAASPVEEAHVQAQYAPSMAACIRSVFAAYMWHTGILPDAMVLSTYLKFHPNQPRPVVKGDSQIAEALAAFQQPPPPLDSLAEGTAVLVNSRTFAVAQKGKVVSVNPCAVAAAPANGDFDGLAVNQRLEAKDRKNPNMICVATISEIRPDGQVNIHFDGWSESFDYVAGLDDDDLHPVGYCQSIGYKLQAPRGYVGNFTWPKYLKEIGQSPVPMVLLDGPSNQAMISCKAAADGNPGYIAHPLHPHPLHLVDRDNGWGCDGRRQEHGLSCGRDFGQCRGLPRYRCINEGCDFDLCPTCMSHCVAFENKDEPAPAPGPKKDLITIELADGKRIDCELPDLRLFQSAAGSAPANEESSDGLVPKLLVTLWERSLQRVQFLVSQVARPDPARVGGAPEAAKSAPKAAGGLFGAPAADPAAFNAPPAHFGFGAAAGFGAAVANGPALFGKAVQPGGFGFAQPAVPAGGFAFGAPAQPAGFGLGAPAAPGGLFGAPAVGLFGAPAPAFGAPPAAFGAPAPAFGAAAPAFPAQQGFGAYMPAPHGQGPAGFGGAQPVAQAAPLFGRAPAKAGGKGLVVCDLCKESHPSPITIHMSAAHKGCGNNSFGDGYDSSGVYRGGWCGRCGDGGQPATPWYLMCKACRTKYQKAGGAGGAKADIKAEPAVPSAPFVNTIFEMTSKARFLLQLSSAYTEVLPDADAAKLSRDCSPYSYFAELLASVPSTENEIVPATPTLLHSHSVSTTAAAADNEFKPVGTAAAPVPPPVRPTLKHSMTIVDHKPVTPPSEGRRRPALLRAKSLPTDPDAILSPSEAPAAAASQGPLNKPSRALSSLSDSLQSSDSVLEFVRAPVALKDITAAMQRDLQEVARRRLALLALDRLLRTVSSTGAIHDILWSFVSALSRDQKPQMSEGIDASFPRNIHPTTGISCAGPIADSLRAAFHSLLHTTMVVMGSPKLPAAVVQVALRCWSIQFDPRDHAFLHRSHVFSVMSSVLAVLNEQAQHASASGKGDEAAHTFVDSPLEVSKAGRMSVSSREQSAELLVNNTTENFWETSDDDREKFIQFQYDENDYPVEIAVYVDNTRDRAQKVAKLVSLSGPSVAGLEQRCERRLADTFCGWVTLPLENEAGKRFSFIQVQLSGAAKIRIRQIRVFAGLKPSPTVASSLPAVRAAEALKVFRDLASEIFGLSAAPADKDGNGEGQELRQHVVGVLFDQGSSLSSLQTQVSQDILREIHDATRKLLQTSEESTHTDAYCFELLSMLSSLAASPMGSAFLAKAPELVNDLLAHLHFGPPRSQRIVVRLLQKVLRNDPRIINSSIVSCVQGHAGLLPMLLLVIAKSMPLQVRTKAQAKESLSIELNQALQTSGSVWLRGTIQGDIAQEVIGLITGLMSDSTWATVLQAGLRACVDQVAEFEEDSITAAQVVARPTTWLSLAAMCVMEQEVVPEEVKAITQAAMPCDNHDDGRTAAVRSCETCQASYCDECDRVIHLSKVKRTHVRNAVRAAERGGLVIERHETCCRAKLSTALVVVDRRTLKSVIEFRRATTSAVCRFCSNPLGDDGGVATFVASGVHGCCTNEECVELAKNLCTKTLPCGHPCNGVRDEATCLPCLRGCSKDTLFMDSEDLCPICFTTSLAEEPCVLLDCRHVFHFRCIRRLLTMRWSGPRITFGYCRCPTCSRSLVDLKHPILAPLVEPVRILYEEVRKKALLRLSYDGLEAQAGATEAERAEFAIDKYAYYLCFKCKHAYFGGLRACQDARGDDFNPADLICPMCVEGPAMQECPRHGSDFLEYKCRFCCSVAVFFCFGTTHFCNPCHDDHQRCVSAKKESLPHCPAGPRLTQLEGDECPLHVKHPPTGEEFALGCGICRNAQTF
eukprot:m.202671 g.202671  ORF g.202671 m.202671 type:complete len:4234 (-) comp10109_c2_seq9:387-13088(-)